MNQLNALWLLCSSSRSLSFPFSWPCRFFTVGGNRTWTVQIPAANVANCNTNVLAPKRAARITNLAQCTPATDTACWNAYPTASITLGGHTMVTTSTPQSCASLAPTSRPADCCTSGPGRGPRESQWLAGSGDLRRHWAVLHFPAQ